MDQERFVKELTDSIMAEVGENISGILSQSLKQHVDQAMQKIFTEKEFYRRVSDNMLNGLQKIYKEINQATKNEKKVFLPDKQNAGKLFLEANKQLDDIMTTTLEATENIMEKTELLFEHQEEIKQLLVELESAEGVKSQLQRINELNEENSQVYTAILEALSFQDLTGQRLKKVIDALGKISTIVFELYISSGLMLKNEVNHQEKNFEVLSKESKNTANALLEGSNSELKGPSKDGQSQNNVDDLLASLGL
ncbi:protein phosphatase CheZ [Desulfovibrio litoralis]|uniref:Chemotaxis protein CheZ n=1 Tax=Desulfovibrio litoralis DSM 11393 TaxID=1121455 RepID=A0A1M7THU5_9BACT|nr:protein phosphatase CheZ [Desulfovibrio litoralis]SHN70297.1 chemotaxis protein CheZ [Desulfovibrio litoralis DSM 11393]